MAVLESRVVAKNSGAAFEVRKGQRLRIAGKSIVDFVAFNLHDLNERFDQARTKTNQVKIFISTGDVLYSKRNNPMLTIVEDTFKEGRHDLQKGMCSRKRFEMVAQGTAHRVFAEGVDINPKKPEEIPDHGCWENLSGAVKPGISRRTMCPARSISFNACTSIRRPASCTIRLSVPRTRRTLTSEPKWIASWRLVLARNRGEGRRFGWRSTKSRDTC
jgi:hypothetical protein